MLSGALTMGIEAVVPDHVTTVFHFWQNSSIHCIEGVSKFSTSHDLLWVETMMSSVVSFLKFSPDLLLAVPDALTRITALLEKVFPLISSGGRFEREENDSVGSARLSSTRSSVMEAYSWLPPGKIIHRTVCVVGVDIVSSWLPPQVRSRCLQMGYLRSQQPRFR